MQPDMTRTKVILMFAAVVVLSIGGIIYFKKVHEPKQRIADAQDEIHGWNGRWVAARDCLLGTTPGSGHVFADLLVRDEPNAIAAPFSLERFVTGALVAEHGAAAVAH